MRIVPEITALTEPYWQGVRAGKIMLQRCCDCNRVWHPPEPICGACQSSNIVWEPAAGDGTVYSYTVAHHATHDAFVDRVPYLVALIELSEGPRMVSTVVGEVERVTVGMRVAAVFASDGDGVMLPKFEPTPIHGRDGPGPSPRGT